MPELRIGAHTSIAKSAGPFDGPANAIHQQVEIGGNCGQIFTHSPQVWQDPDIDAGQAETFREETATAGIGPWVIHSSYLVNLCTPKDDLRQRSVDSMQAELDAAALLDISYVNVHLGAHTGAGEEGGLDNAAQAIDSLDVPDGVTLLIETDAGSGTKLGDEFEHLAGIQSRTETPLEFCLDTAHVFAAGYDISSPEGVARTVSAFDDAVGVEALSCIHLNDSKHACGTNKDEHAHIGEGKIGESGMRAIINHDVLGDVPLILETPTEDGRSYAWNVQRVRELHQGS
ncbi:MAG: deoxyribonuclease IV [Halodesulfurarchaeum sp.]